MSLNPDQQQVLQELGNCLVLACPGSGKTHTAISKTGAILSQSVDHKVCLISFTRESAREIKNRLIKEYGQSVMKRTLVGTFHSIFIRHLTSQKKFNRILTPSEQTEYIRRTQKECGVDYKVEEVQQIIESCKTILENIIPKLSIGERRVYQTYQELMSRNKVMDLQDVLIQSARMLITEDLPPLPVTHMIVDEYQDVDPIQYELIVQHALRGIITTVVGDDDQAIYVWRNAMGCLGMEKFEQATSARRITLGVNYRCREEILSAADRLIFNNQNRYNKKLFSVRGMGGSVHVHRKPSREDEANDVRSKIQVDLSRGLKEKEWAVLARTNRILNVIEAELSVTGVPYYRPGKGFWQGVPQCLMLAFLRCLETGEKSGIDQILHWAGFNKSDLDLLHKDDEDFSKLLSGTGNVTLKDYPAELRKQLSSFINQIPEWRRIAGSRKRRQLVVNGFCEWMESTFSGQKKDKDPGELKRKQDDAINLIRMVQFSLNKMEGSFAQREATLTKKNVDSTNDESKVSLLTFHGSKGLEFSKVWILGANAVVTPGQSSIEEERRLFYVAMTRARDELHVSSVMDGRDNTPSQFISEFNFS